MYCHDFYPFIVSPVTLEWVIQTGIRTENIMSVSKTIKSGILMMLTLGIFSAFSHAENTLSVGDMAPEFTLKDQHNQTQSLENYRDKWLVLYFYPKDETPGCTKEACNFRDQYETLIDHHAKVLGVSLDSVESHEAFSEKYNLPFPLLADPDGKTAIAYGSLKKIGPLKFASRHSFIIDPDGKIAKIYRSVKPSIHSEEVLKDLQSLQNKS